MGASTSANTDGGDPAGTGSEWCVGRRGGQLGGFIKMPWVPVPGASSTDKLQELGWGCLQQDRFLG